MKANIRITQVYLFSFISIANRPGVYLSLSLNHHEHHYLHNHHHGQCVSAETSKHIAFIWVLSITVCLTLISALVQLTKLGKIICARAMVHQSGQLHLSVCLFVISLHMFCCILSLFVSCICFYVWDKWWHKETVNLRIVKNMSQRYAWPVLSGKLFSFWTTIELAQKRMSKKTLLTKLMALFKFQKIKLIVSELKRESHSLQALMIRWCEWKSQLFAIFFDLTYNFCNSKEYKTLHRQAIQKRGLYLKSKHWITPGAHQVTVFSTIKSLKITSLNAIGKSAIEWISSTKGDRICYQIAQVYCAMHLLVGTN